MKYSPRWFCVVLVTSAHLFVSHRSFGDTPENFRTDNLVAWCIVPFDASKRGPADRAEMVKELGLSRIAYDWRQEHISEFEEEIQQYQKHGIEFFAFWSWHDSLTPLIEKYKIRPQIWMMLKSPHASTQSEKVQLAAEQLLPMAKRTKNLGCKLGIYNHGGWAGEPLNMVAVCKHLREKHGFEHVGIVYNCHHGHSHIEGFEKSFKAMQPYLLCLNLNGMADPQSVQGIKNKIIPIGSGQHEAKMINTVIESGYHGPIGILDHRSEFDSKESLQMNIDGLSKLLDN